jgi:hypothetical protein
MSLLNSASLVVTPNGYKEGTLYSVIPNTTLGDMTVVRATTATRVNSAGLIELVPYNLLQYSEQFDNAAWTKNNVSVTANTTTAPNGTLTASRINETAVTNVHRLFLNPTVSANKHTYSVYLKAGTRNWAFLRLDGLFTEQRTWFDIQNGTIGTTNGDHIASIENVGNGWYRCSVSIAGTTYDTTPLAILGLADANGVISYAGDVNKYIYAWGAQLVAGTLPKDYQKTETRLNIPRLDYSNGTCPSLLVEPQRTNLLTYSEQFDNAAWTKPTTTISANAITAPDGTLTADKLVPSAVLSPYKEIWQNVSTTTGQPYTFSIFAKAGEYTYLQLIGNGTGFGSFAFNVDLSTGLETYYDSTGSTVNSRGIINYGNGWYKVFISVNAISTSSNRIAPQVIPAGNSVRGVSWTPDGTSGLYLWGAQFELGSYPTSYIPTTTAAVTRNADAISKTGISSLINSVEGVLYAEVAALANDGTSRQLSLSDGSSANNKISISFTSTTNQIQAFIRAAGSISFNSTFTLTNATSLNKLAIKWKLNDFALWVNGTEVATDISGGVPVGLSKLSFDDADGTSIFFSKFQNLIIFPSALSDTELATLTTL